MQNVAAAAEPLVKDDIHPEPQPKRERNPYIEGNFAPIQSETTAFDLPVTGTIPAELSGRYIRIGPNPIAPVQPFNWLTGTGMIHGLRLRDGKAEWYRSRYAVSSAVADALGRSDIAGPLAGTGNVNTHIINLGGVVHAAVEAGAFPVELSYELDSVARSSLGGTLDSGFSGHPKRDPRTGEMFALTYQPGRPFIGYVVVDKYGRANTAAKLMLPHGPLIHDVAITETYVVVPDLPVHFQPERMATGMPYGWDPEHPPRIGLLPRDGDEAKLRWFEAPVCFVYHFMNAYDIPGGVVIDLVTYDRTFDRDTLGPFEGADPRLMRWTIDLASGRLTETALAESGLELPRINDAFCGTEYRYGYTASVAEHGTRFDSVYKHDLKTGAVTEHRMGPDRQTLEPVFVARDGAAAEDDGWLMMYVYDRTRHASDVVILDSQDVAGGPVATIRLPVRVPFGFHGDWIADATLKAA